LRRDGATASRNLKLSGQAAQNRGKSQIIDRSWPEEPPVKSNSSLRSYRNPRRVGMIRINDNVCVAPRCDNRGDHKQCGSLALNPVATEGLRDRGIVKIVPTWKQGRIKFLARYVVRNDGFNKSRRTRRRLPISMYENLDKTDGEACACINRRQTRRIPALAKQAGSLTRPNRMSARDNTPKPNRHGS
jgi:hypothetical protein